MFYKIRNILMIALSFVVASTGAMAQGLVSLSEEAMFEDELDTEVRTPETKKETADVKSEAVDELGVRLPKAMPTAPETPKKEILPELDIKPKATEAVAPKAVPAPTTIEPAKAEIEDAEEIAGKLAEGDDSDLYNTLDGKTNLKGNDVFEHMSDIEKRTAILNLELRREKLQDDIEAIKFRRREALAKEKQKAEEQRLKNIEAEKEIERKLLEEEAKLRELDIQFEKVRQEKVLGAYKNKMLEETQKWIEHDGVFYKQIADLRESKVAMAEDLKKKMETIKNGTIDARAKYVQTIKDYDKRIEDKDSQISILRTRVANLEKEREEARRNPFAGFDKAQLAAAAGIDISVLEAVTRAQAGAQADVSEAAEPVETDLTKMYAVTEIRGKGNELVARLVNQNGTAFYVKKGTTLQSGHVINKITTTFVMAEKAGDKQYLYFSAGGVLPTEVPNASAEAAE